MLTALVQDFLASESNFTKEHEKPDKQAVAQTYGLSGTLCTPKGGAKHADHVQYLIHGVGFDSRYVTDFPMWMHVNSEGVILTYGQFNGSYWDFSVSEEYSYVRAAADAGFTTFRYDRLGTGLSDKPRDAYKYATTLFPAQSNH